MEPHEHMDHWTRAGHAIAQAGFIATLVGILPAITGILIAIWYAIAIWETKTVRAFRAWLRTKVTGHGSPPTS